MALSSLSNFLKGIHGNSLQTYSISGIIAFVAEEIASENKRKDINCRTSFEISIMYFTKHIKIFNDISFYFAKKFQ